VRLRPEIDELTPLLPMVAVPTAPPAPTVTVYVPEPIFIAEEDAT
jgi:hypothetical protein